MLERFGGNCSLYIQEFYLEDSDSSCELYGERHAPFIFSVPTSKIEASVSTESLSTIYRLHGVILQKTVDPAIGEGIRISQNFYLHGKTQKNIKIVSSPCGTAIPQVAICIGRLQTKPDSVKMLQTKIHDFFFSVEFENKRGSNGKQQNTSAMSVEISDGINCETK